MLEVLLLSSDMLYTRNKSLFWNKAHRYRCNSFDSPVHYTLSFPYLLHQFLSSFCRGSIYRTRIIGRHKCRPYNDAELSLCSYTNYLLLFFVAAKRKLCFL